ncbi:MAG: GH39 family glycosyl hydrolase [Armatimonadota bacterium]
MPFPHFWEHTVGSDHAPVALRADWQAQLRRCREELGFQHVRFHGLLSDRVGTLICHKNKFLYSFFNADQICDFLLSIGMRPFVELSFMPETLSSGQKTVFNYKGNVTPPKNYREWGRFIGRLVAHWADRYGVDEVAKWFFEVWNEPNLHHFWTGTQRDYFRLYHYTADAIKRVDATLKVGGPATAANEWIEEFLAFCDSNKLPADFVTTHHYPTDAFGEPGDDTETQLAKSRRSVLREQTQDARRRTPGLPLYYTEWNTSSNPRDPLHDQPYAAAFVTKTIMEAAGLVEGYSFWTFTDIFEENYSPSVPFHGGFGLMTIHGVPKPTYRAYQLLHRLGTERLVVDGMHTTVDAWVIRKENAATVLLTNHALPRHPIAAEHVDIFLTDAPRPRSVSLERIDDVHANPRRVWEEMGAPDYPSPAQIARLQDSSALSSESVAWRYEAGTIRMTVTLPPHAVAAVTVRLAEGRSR